MSAGPSEHAGLGTDFEPGAPRATSTLVDAEAALARHINDRIAPAAIVVIGTDGPGDEPRRLARSLAGRGVPVDDRLTPDRPTDLVVHYVVDDGDRRRLGTSLRQASAATDQLLLVLSTDQTYDRFDDGPVGVAVWLTEQLLALDFLRDPDFAVSDPGRMALLFRRRDDPDAALRSELGRAEAERCSLLIERDRLRLAAVAAGAAGARTVFADETSAELAAALADRSQRTADLEAEVQILTEELYLARDLATGAEAARARFEAEASRLRHELDSTAEEVAFLTAAVERLTARSASTGDGAERNGSPRRRPGDVLRAVKGLLR